MLAELLMRGDLREPRARRAPTSPCPRCASAAICATPWCSSPSSAASCARSGWQALQRAAPQLRGEAGAPDAAQIRAGSAFRPDRSFAEAARIEALLAEERAAVGRERGRRWRGRRSKGQPIHGWLCLDKPQGMTSTEAVSRVRRITQRAQGRPWRHPRPAGDRRAADRAWARRPRPSPTSWRGASTTASPLRLGEARTTDDAEGEVLATSERAPDQRRDRGALPRFVGRIEQVPPRFAAVKVEGERAYDLARRGEAVELAPRAGRRSSGSIWSSGPIRDHVDVRGACAAAAPTCARWCAISARRSAVSATSSRCAGCRSGRSASAEAVSLDRARAGWSPTTRCRRRCCRSAPRSAICRRWPLTQPQVDRLRAGQTIRVAPGLLVGEAGARRHGARHGRRPHGRARPPARRRAQPGPRVQPVKPTMRQSKPTMSITPERKQDVMTDFATQTSDTGSPEVQVAMLTERITNLTEHLKAA